MDSPYFSCRAVAFNYRRTRALDGINLDISRGVTGILGPNGAGKSTLMSVMTTLRKPNSGDVQLFGKAAASKSAVRKIRAQIGYLPQKFSLPMTMKVGDLLAYCAWMHNHDESVCDELAEQALESVGMQDSAKRRVRQLSGGQRQRIGIATAIVHQPRLLVLDEPTVGLDPIVRVQIRRTFAELGTESAVVLSTHLVEDIDRVCPRTIVLRAGQVVFDGRTKELAAHGREMSSEENLKDFSSPLEAAYADVLREK